MDNEKKISEGKLLYDPMFAKKPELDWTDSEKGGIFGKSKVKKTLFIIVLLIAIGGSLFFSFNSLSKEKYEFTALDDGTYQLSAFHGQKTDTVLNIDYYRDGEDVPDGTKPVTKIREYTISGNDMLQFIFIGRDVKEIEPTAFYYCTALKAIFVDDENEYFADVDGVLYGTENGVPTRAILCPQDYSVYLTALDEGMKAPENEEEAAKFAEKFATDDVKNEYSEKFKDESFTSGRTYILPETVTEIEQLCFAYCDKMTEIKIPDGVKSIGTMAFFGCSVLKEAYFPDGLESIGSDAFSKCGALTKIFIPASVKTIGHHAFWNCPKLENVYMAADSLDGMECGQNWKPQYRKVLLHNRQINFSAERSDVK